MKHSYQFFVQDIQGNVQPGATVEVRRNGSLVQIYSDAEGAPKQNPFQADSNAYALFYADSATYDITATFGGGSVEFVDVGIGAVESLNVVNRYYSETDVTQVSKSGRVFGASVYISRGNSDGDYLPPDDGNGTVYWSITNNELGIIEFTPAITATTLDPVTITVYWYSETNDAVLDLQGGLITYFQTQIDDFIDDGNARINDAISNITGENIGVYGTNPTYTNHNQYATYERLGVNELWYLKATVPLDYSIDSTTYPDPSDDNNLRKSNDQATILQVIARQNGVSDSNVAYLTIGTVSGVNYFYDSATQVTYFSPVTITGELTNTGTDVDGNRTIIVDAVGYEISSGQLIYVNSVEGMKARSYPLMSIVKTGGYRNVFDEGGAAYIIKSASQSASDGDVIDEWGVITLNDGNIAVIQVKNSTVNLAQYGSTGIAGEDNTAPMQAALNFGQRINPDRGFTYEIPYGVHEAAHLSIDRTIVSRAVTFKGTVPPAPNGGCVVKITDTSQPTGIEWDSGFNAVDVIFDHSDARSVGTAGNPRWLIDIRNTDAADSTADLDVEFHNCWVQNFHRSIRLAGRGFLWNGGSIILGGGAVSEGCFLDLLWPSPFEPGTGPDQTAVTGMRSIRIVSPRIHACTGTLVHNRGANANNLAQIDFDGIFSDTLMGLMRGAIVNVNINGGTWLSCPTIFLRVEAGFDMKNVNLNAPNLLGMPEENIGQATSGGTVDAATVLSNAQGTILFVDPAAGIVEGFSHVGGIVSDVATDAYQINKAINGFNLNNVTMRNMMKDNKDAGGAIRNVVNFFSTSSTNININGNIVKNLSGMAQNGRLIGNDENCTEISSSDNKLSGAILESSTRPANKNFGGDQSQVYCGSFTGEGGDTNITKYTASRFAKSVIVQQITGSGSPSTWMQIDNGDSTLDVRLNNGQLDCRQSANVPGAVYTYTMFF